MGPAAYAKGAERLRPPVQVARTFIAWWTSRGSVDRYGFNVPPDVQQAHLGTAAQEDGCKSRTVKRAGYRPRAMRSFLRAVRCKRSATRKAQRESPYMGAAQALSRDRVSRRAVTEDGA